MKVNMVILFIYNEIRYLDLALENVSQAFKILFVCWLLPPQRSWGKVIFSEACIKNSVHRGRGV